MNVKNKEQIKRNEIFLKPGESFWGGEQDRVITILGSCVSICVWHPGLKIGGICHYRFPGQRKKRRETLNLNFGDDSIWFLIENVKKNYTKPEDYITEIYGGSSMFNNENTAMKEVIGMRNVHSAIERLAGSGFKIHSKHIGGTISRKIVFDLYTGEVDLRLNGQ